MKTGYRRISLGGIILILLMCLCYNVKAQQVVTIKGTLRDSLSQMPLQNASVVLKSAKKGTITDSNGNFQFILPITGKEVVEFSLVGYKTYTQPITIGTDSVIVLNISLVSSANQISNVTVTNKRKKYSNKNNPAVELIRKVIEHKDENRMTAHNFASYKQYERLQVLIDNSENKLMKNKILRKFEFFWKNVDTTKIEGKALVPLYMEETLTENYYRKEPEKSRTDVIAHKKVDYGEFIDTRGVSSYLNRLYEPIDIYENTISLFTTQFISPIANTSPSFYFFYIRDTTDVGTHKEVRMYFTPRNTADFLFRGTLFINLNNYAVTRVHMFVSNNINLNFIRDVQIDLKFKPSNDNRYFLSESDIVANFGLFKKEGNLYGERLFTIENFSTDSIPDYVLSQPSIKPQIGEEYKFEKSDTFWTNNRPDSLSKAEAQVYGYIDSLKNMKSFKRLMNIATLLLAGYTQAGPVEIGPANAFYSFNPVEGFRLRFGGRSTTKLSKRYYFETYGAYGFKDEKFKYFGSFTYSLNNKSVYGFPKHYVRASFQHDTKIPGQELQFVQEDNFLLSFKRGNNDKWLYNDIFRFEYLRELESHLSYTLGLKYWRQKPAGTIEYLKPINNVFFPLEHLTTTELNFTLRWAPNEQFYMGKLYRVPIYNKYPIFTLRYNKGIDGFLGGKYNYDNLSLNIFKRFYVAPFGYSDVNFDAGYVFGKLPFPLLTIHRANQTYSYQLTSYNLMNFLEFVSDHFVSVNIDHYFNGFFLNKIPLVKKLKLREVISAKVLYGGMRDENNPYKNPEQMRFPTTDGVTTTFILDNDPYVEGSVGLANIFKIIRVDLVKRFTYLNHPDVAEWGVRARVKFDF